MILHLIRTVGWFFARGRKERELREELEFHLAEEAEKKASEGLSDRDARIAARRDLGSTSLVGEDTRASWGWSETDHLLRDVGYGIRSMLRHPGTSAIHILLIALSIGLFCTSFVVMNAVLYRPLPAIASPDQLFMVDGVDGNCDRCGMPLRVFEHLAERQEGTSHIFAYRNYGGLPASIAGSTVPVRGIGVVGDFSGGLGGVPLSRGRFFDADETQPVAVIADWVWRDRFNAAPDILERTLTLGTVTFSIVGVAQSEFLGLQPDLRWDVIAPFLALNRARGIIPDVIHDQLVYVVARLAPTVSPTQYEDHVSQRWPEILKTTVPPDMAFDEWTQRRGRILIVESLRHGQTFTLITTPGLARALNLTTALSGLIFLASCVTLALLVVARAVRNQRSSAIRLALGGSAWRVVRPQIIELGLLSLLGCGTGLGFAVWASEFARSYVPGDWPIGVTRSGVALAILLAVATTALGSGLAAYVGTRGVGRAGTSHGDRTSRPHVRLRIALLTTQFVVAVVLVQATLLYASELAGLGQVDPGIDSTNLRVYGLASRLPQRTLGPEYFQQLLSELGGVSSVESVGFTGTSGPMSFLRDLTESIRTADGRDVPAATACLFPGVLDTWRARRIDGRDVAWTDGPVALVTESLAAKLYPGQNVVSRTIRSSAPGSYDRTVVGVVNNMAFNGPQLGVRDVVFWQCLDWRQPFPSSFGLQVFIRSPRSLEELESDVSRVVDRLGVHYVYDRSDQEEINSWSMGRERMLATLSGAFAGLILAMTGIGLSAFCNYMLAFRNRELAIRASLGAAPHKVVLTLLRETGIVLTLGVGIGLAVYHVMVRLLESLIGEIGSAGLTHSVQAILVLVIVAGFAALVPSLRALRIDLARALRVD